MDQLSKLLQQLADKLGTTVTYLWGVLVKEAFINGLSNLFIYLIAAIIGYILYRINKYCLNDENKFGYAETEGAIAVPVVIVFLAWVVLVVICVFGITDTMNSFFNPEYWALHTILETK